MNDTSEEAENRSRNAGKKIDDETCQFKDFPELKTVIFSGETAEATPRGEFDTGENRTVALADSTSRSKPQLPEQFGRYAIVKELGSGMMGTVFLARDTQLDRLVALKVPQFGDDPEQKTLARFYREARSMATLRHPNLCPVHDVGEIDGITYLTMAYIEGNPLSESLKQDRLSGDQAATLIRKLALALQEAHQAGIVHRDLKPANIMVDKRGEPVIMDFGLARREHEGEARLTSAGSILGTPGYMSPEQIQGDPEKMGPPSDVYSLGVILYELLAERIPFEGPIAKVLMEIMNEEPVPPSQLRDGVNPVLEAVCMKAMAKQTEDRYGSAGELAAALGKYLRAQNQGTDQLADTEQVEIVIAEDSSAQAMFLGKALLENGYNVRRGKNGQEALSLVRDRKPTLVISDVEMPVMDGYELCRAIKSDKNLRDIPVVLLSTLSDPEDIINGLRVGADNYVTKPYEISFLLARIDSLLSTPCTRKKDETKEQLDVTVAGKSYTVMSDSQQMLNLLISTFESAVQRNSELMAVKQRLTTVQEDLKSKNTNLREITLELKDLRTHIKDIQEERG